jgi:hypothetical protein
MHPVIFGSAASMHSSTIYSSIGKLGVKLGKLGSDHGGKLGSDHGKR